MIGGHLELEYKIFEAPDDSTAHSQQPAGNGLASVCKAQSCQANVRKAQSCQQQLLHLPPHLCMSFGGFLRVSSHQLLTLLLVLHHLLHRRWIADLLNLGVLTLRFNLSGFGF